jgi:diguanylate cyclase
LVENQQEDATAAVRGRLAPLIQGRFVMEQCAIDYAGASFGIVCVDPEQYTPDQALKEADAAMYQDKRARKRQG